MAPKAKKKGKKKSAAELEAERLALEEQMRLEEEERQRIAEEERKRLEAEEAERRRLEKEHLDAESELLASERQGLEPLFLQHAKDLAAAEAERVKVSIIVLSVGPRMWYLLFYTSNAILCSVQHILSWEYRDSGSGLGQVHRVHTSAERRRFPFSSYIHAQDECNPRYNYTGLPQRL
mmetsp:Transcript_331/g.1001  ORF Transcript_331/g.1001 Transcript_331/m.1001 type:complete len:178 (-) Transcript_331:1914-2447(-)